MFVAVLIISSLLAAVYFFRVIEWAYFRQPEATVSEDEPVELPETLRQELPVQMLMPILVLATSILLLGLFNQTIITHVIQYAMPQGGFK